MRAVLITAGRPPDLVGPHHPGFRAATTATLGAQRRGIPSAIGVEGDALPRQTVRHQRRQGWGRGYLLISPVRDRSARWPTLVEAIEMHTTRVIQAALDNDSANSRRKLRNLSQRGHMRPLD